MRLSADAVCRCSCLRHERMLSAYAAIQNRLAGMNPNCAVCTPITQMGKLFTAATASPIHSLQPTRIVESTVNRQER